MMLISRLPLVLVIAPVLLPLGAEVEAKSSGVDYCPVVKGGVLGGTKPWLGIIGATSWDVAFGSWHLRGLCLGRYAVEAIATAAGWPKSLASNGGEVAWPA